MGNMKDRLGPLTRGGGAPKGNQNARKDEIFDAIISLKATGMQKAEYKRAARKAKMSLNAWIREELDSVILLQ